MNAGGRKPRYCTIEGKDMLLTRSHVIQCGFAPHWRSPTACAFNGVELNRSLDAFNGVELNRAADAFNRVDLYREAEAFSRLELNEALKVFSLLEQDRSRKGRRLSSSCLCLRFAVICGRACLSVSQGKRYGTSRTWLLSGRRTSEPWRGGTRGSRCLFCFTS